MAQQELTLDDLTRILRTAAGEPADADLDGDILDLTFDLLGYDSVALLETASRIERQFGVTLDDTTLSGGETPRALLAAVNSQLAAASQPDRTPEFQG